MPWNKYCRWGTCKSNSKKVECENIVFHKFPKPCVDFNLLKNDPKLKIKHNVNDCVKCRLSQDWVNACKVEKFKAIEQITRDSFVCSQHFLEGKPTATNPSPIPAGTMVMVSLIIGFI